jgi:ribose 5-phosphate isomerase RpiB
MCLAGRKTPVKELIPMAEKFLSTAFEGGRHQTRVEMIEN